MDQMSPTGFYDSGDFTAAMGSAAGEAYLGFGRKGSRRSPFSRVFFRGLHPPAGFSLLEAAA
jgi:hypothetical protein